MKSTPLSLKAHMNSLVLEDSRVISDITFPRFGDFQNAGKYYGERPLVFSFEKIFTIRDGWMELMDGYLFLTTLLYSSQKIHPLTIFPKIAKNILPSNLPGFNYSAYCFNKMRNKVTDKIFIFMDYFENVTDQLYLNSAFEKINKICSEYQEVHLIPNFHIGSFGEDLYTGDLYRGMTLLPNNCKMLSCAEFSKINNLYEKEVVFIRDENVMTHSVWEEITLLKNGYVQRDKISTEDKIIHEFDIYPGLKRQIFNFKDDPHILDNRQQKELHRIVGMVEKKTDILNENFKRLIKDIINVAGSES